MGRCRPHVRCNGATIKQHVTRRREEAREHAKRAITTSRPPTDAGQISFTPDGDQLVVTQKDTNTIDVCKVHRSGRPGAPVANPAAGVTPFGFAFDRRHRLVASNVGGEDSSTATSHRVTAMTPVVLNDADFSDRGGYLFVIGACADTIAAFRLARGGALVPIGRPRVCGRLASGWPAA